MMKICTVVLVILSLSLNSAPVFAESLSSIALQKASTVQLQQTPQPAVRSGRNNGLFWGGLAVLAIGALTVLGTQEEIVYEDMQLKKQWPKGQIIGGSVVAGTGLWMMLKGK